MRIGGNEDPVRETNFAAEVNLAVLMTLKRYAEATAEHFKSLPELEQIARSRLSADPAYTQNNLHQQAGKSAEVKHVARTNSENIIARTGVKIARTDNIGYPNHQEFDFAAVDLTTGQPVADELAAGGQMKVHKDITKYRAHYKQNFEKYGRAELVVPGDHYDAVMKDWSAQQDSLMKQRDELLASGQSDLAKQKQKAIDQIEDARKRVRRSPVTSADAMEARTSPTSSAVKDALDVSHRAGLEAAKCSAVIGGGMSAVRNVVAVVKAGKPLDEAALEVCKDVGTSAAGAYASAAASSMIGGSLQAANNQVMQNLGRSNVPAMAVQAAATIGKSAIELARGRISSEEFVRNVTKDSTMMAVSMTGSNLGAIVGTAVLPGVGTLVGGLVGGMVASMLSGRLHAELMQSVANMDASNALRAHTQAVCIKIKAEHEAYQLEMHAAFDVFYREKSQALKQSFDMVATASADGRSIHEGLSSIAATMNKQLAFDSRDAFSRHLRSQTALSF